ncbi:ABC transporter permease [bacterium]|nr:ABC transporter permease [bacterium]
MFKSNLISSLRFLRRNERFAFVNVLGLTSGFSCILLILFFVRHELSFEDFHENRNNVYRINFSYEDNSSNVTILVNSPPAFAPEIKERFPEIVRVSRMRYVLNALLANGRKQFYENHGYYADSSFLKTLQFPFLSGDRETALREPNSIVITKAMAEKYFDDPDPVGSTLLWNNTMPLKVTGVLDVPSNSHLNFDFLISFQNYLVPPGYSSDLTSWDWLGFLTYVELKDGTDPADFQTKLHQFFRDRESSFRPLVQNIADIYFGSDGMADDLSSHIRSGNKFSVYALIVVAFLILVIAGFNFASLTNAISINRIRGIGIRKILGAERQTIAIQLLTESLVITLICLLLAYGLSAELFPIIGTWLQWEIPLQASKIFETIPLLISVALILGLLAGLYPALILSGYDIVKALKEEFRFGRRSLFQFKDLLVTLQFAVSIGLIAATIVLTRQLDLLQNRSMGFNKENVVVLKMLPEEVSRHFESYRERLRQNSWVLGVSRSERVAGDPWPWSVIHRADESPEQAKVVYFNATDYDFVETMGIHLQAGRSFSRALKADSLNAIIINQKTADMLGLKDPVGQQVHFFGGPRTIIGVADDFQYTSFHQGIGPVVMILPFIDLEYMYVRLAPSETVSRILALEETWRQISGGTPIEWRFLDDRLNQLYQSEERLGLMIRCFAVLALILASLGLYGIVAFMIQNRMKEFGVRKVLGASVGSLYILFIRPYVYLMITAMVLAIPIINYYLNQWLENFAYRTTIEWWTYPVALILLMGVALVTITSQTMRAAKINPVKLLRNE